MSIVKQTGILLLITALAVGGYFGWQQLAGNHADALQSPNGGPVSRGVSVVTAKAEYRDLETLVEAVGSTRARRSVQITPLAAGRVVEIGFRSGQAVEAGNVLLRLDDDIERADLLEAEARLANAISALARGQSLKRTRAVSDATVEGLIADKAIAEAERDRAARRLRDRTLTAPFAGVVGYASIDLGARVNEGDMLTMLDDLSVLEIELSLPENLFGRIAPGQRIVAEAAAFRDRTFDGAIHSIDSRIDPVSRSFKARALVENADLILPAGMFMRLSVVLDAQRALTVPEEALVVDGSRAYVFAVVERDGAQKAERRAVVRGQRGFGLVEIVEGVADGEPVIVRGVQKVRDGSPVRHSPQAGEAPAPGKIAG